MQGPRARIAEVLAERDEGVLAAYVHNEAGSPAADFARRLRLRRSVHLCILSSSVRRSLELAWSH